MIFMITKRKNDKNDYEYPMTSMSLSISVLADNHAAEGFSSEHGFSAFVECDDTRVLFDTGGGTLFAENALKLGVHWWETEAVVLSHGHYDHTGGIAHVLSGNSRAKWYWHPDALLPRYLRRNQDPPKSIGMRPENRASLDVLGERLVRTTRPTRINERIGVTGPIPRLNPEEGTGGDFFLDEAFQTSDPIRDDQALWIRAKGGVIALLGCAHAGVGNTLDYISSLCGERILAVVGGLHLQGDGALRLGAAVDAFRRHGVKYIRPAHCTGDAAVTVLARNFPDAVSPCRAGDVMKL